MRWLVIALLLACSSKKEQPPKPPPAETSHPAMPNQFEVGSTINKRYRIISKIGDVGELNVFSVERTATPDRKLTMVAPKTAAHSRALRDAVMVEMNDKKDFPWLDLDTTESSYFAVGALTDEHVRDILSGAHVLVK